MISKVILALGISTFALYLNPAHAQAKPLKIALIESLTGPQAANGKMYENASRFGVARINKDGGFNSVPVELLVYDNAGSASTASDKFREAVANGATIVLQAASSAINAQLSEDTRRHNLRNPADPVLFLNIGAEASELTGAKCHFYSFRLNTTTTMRGNALLQVMNEANALGDKVYSINQNYALGQEMEQTIVANAAKYNYTVVGKTLHDVARIQDFTPFVAKISASKPTSVITANWANDLLLLAKAMSEANLKTGLGGMYFDQPGNVASAGPIILGSYTSSPYNIEGDKSSMPEDFKTLIGKYPMASEAHSVNMYLFLQQALKKADPRGGKISIKAVAEALETTSIESPVGHVSMRREDHQAILPVMVSKASENARFPLDGMKIGFTVVSVIPGKDAIYPVQESCKMQRP
jgi:branched-chain amino acid transport system substrate-binding protein